MRWLFTFILTVAVAAPVAAQQRTQVRVMASLHIPAIVSLRQGDATEVVTKDGQRVRRLTVFITANTGWELLARRECQTPCRAVVVRAAALQHESKTLVASGTTSLLAGNSGSAIAVTIEQTRDDGVADGDVEYLLTPR